MASPLAAAGAYANIARLATDPSHGARQCRGRRAGKERHQLCLHAQGRDRRGQRGRHANPTRRRRAMVNGKSNMVDVVTAVAETEVAIDARGRGARQGDRGLRRNHEDADLISRAVGE